MLSLYWFFLGPLLCSIVRLLYGSTVIECPDSSQTLKWHRNTLPTLSVCWVSSLEEKRFNNLCGSVFAFLSTLEENPPFRVNGELWLYEEDGNHDFSIERSNYIDCISRRRPDVSLNRHFINKTFVSPLTRVHSGEIFPLVVMARLFLLWVLDSAWIVYMDTDVVAAHPFLQELHSYLELDPNAPIFAVLDVQVNCPQGTEVEWFYQGRQQINFFQQKSFVYYNSGFLVFRNCEMTKRMIRHVIEKIYEHGGGFFYPDQDGLWAFSNTSSYGPLPTKFNCMEIRRLCPLNGCGPETLLYHSHNSTAGNQAERDFNTNCRR
jgi:hypothetical protein